MMNTSRVSRRMIAESGVIPAGMQLIRDVYPFTALDSKLVTESSAGMEGPVLKVTGLFQLGDEPNSNGRIYPTQSVLSPAVKAMQEDVKSRAVLGEYDHPPDARIHLDRVSHLITGLWMEGRKVYGEAEIMHRVPCGAYLRGLFEHKVRVGISSRGVGDMDLVEYKGRQMHMVSPGYMFVTFDAVAEPSVSTAVLGIKESLTKKIRPVQQQQHLFESRVYNDRLVTEINKFFGLK